MQHEITSGGRLLDSSGVLAEPGWSRSPIKEYRRNDIKASGFRIKEWDYYLIYNDDYAVALTVADNSYMYILSASLIDLRNPKEQTTSLMGAFPMGRLGLPQSSVWGVSEGGHKKGFIRFEVDEGVRRLTCRMENFKNNRPFEAEIVLTEKPRDSMVIATPFSGDRRAFYYNQKIIGMRASGRAYFDGKQYIFSPDNSFGLLDWGRGVWTYKNTWYWGAAQGIAEGVPFGFNIGYGFGDTSAASENMIFYDGVAHKFDRLTFGIPQKNGRDDFLSPWHIESNDGRFLMDFVPIIDRASKTNALLICSDQHQVFGKFSGRVRLDDGRDVDIKNLVGFAEKVYNKW